MIILLFSSSFSIAFLTYDRDMDNNHCTFFVGEGVEADAMRNGERIKCTEETKKTTFEVKGM